jgi:hypothetical protein
MSNHTVVLVPIDTWAYNSPDLLHNGQTLDIGLLAECLIYYDRIYLNVANQLQFAELLKWFIKQDRFKTLLSLFRDGTFQVYDYSFMTAAVLAKGVYVLINLQDEIQQKPDTFEQRFLHHHAVQACVENSRQRKALYSALRGQVIEAKASDFGVAIENARQDYEDPERNSIVLQAFIDELYNFRRLGKPPRVQVSVAYAQDKSSLSISWGIDLDNLTKLAGPNLNFHKGVPLTAGAICNRLITSAHQLGCDLYLANPMSILVGDKLYESAYSVYKTSSIIQELRAEVEFPDVRRLVNENKLKLGDILTIRSKATKFRKWLQAEGERDRNAIIAYHNEVARELGIISYGKKALELFGIIGGSAIGAYIGEVVSGHIGVPLGAGAGSTVAYLLGIGSKIGSDWKPVVFGKWMSDRIAKLVEERGKHGNNTGG